MSNKPKNQLSDEQKAEIIEAKKLYAQLNESLARKTSEFEEAKRILDAKNESLSALIARYIKFNEIYQINLNLGNYTQSQLDEEESKFTVLKSELEKLQNATESAEKEYQEKKDVISQAEVELSDKLEVLNKLLGQNFVQAKDNDERNKLASNLNSLLGAKNNEITSVKKATDEALNTDNDKNKKLNELKDKADNALKDCEEKIKNFDKAKSESQDIGVDLNELNQALEQGKNSIDNFKQGIEAKINNEIRLLHSQEKPGGIKFWLIAGHHQKRGYPPVDLSAEKGPCWWRASPHLNSGHNEDCLNKVNDLKEKLKRKLDAIEKIATAKNQLETAIKDEADAEKVYTKAKQEYDKNVRELQEAKDKIESEIIALKNSIDSLKELNSKEQDLLSADVNARTTKDLGKTKQAELLKAQENLDQKQTELNSLLKWSEQIKLDFEAIEQSTEQANKEFQDKSKLVAILNEDLENLKLEHQDAKETFEGLSSLYQYDGREECSSQSEPIIGQDIIVDIFV